MNEVRVGSWRAWFLASRPKTLAGAAAPVMIGGSMAWKALGMTGDAFHVVPFVLCLLFAILMQIDANFINDYYDFKKGTDREDRLGPERACAQGWIKPGSMRRGIVWTTVLSLAVGLPLIAYGGWWMLAVAAVCVVFSFLYTTRLSYLGWGDVLVVVFFGLVPVGFTYYLLTGEYAFSVLCASLGCGLATDCLLMVNNYRDRHEDEKSGKQTIVVRLGGRLSLRIHLWLGLSAAALAVNAMTERMPLVYAAAIIPYLIMYGLTHLNMRRKDGKDLNSVLGQTAFSIILYAVGIAASFIIFRLRH